MPHRKDEKTRDITELIVKAGEKARRETRAIPEPELTRPIEWPVSCTVGPGLEGAIACETKIGYVNGSKGWLIYRGYDIFELCAYSTFEEVSYLLLHGNLPTKKQLAEYNKKLVDSRNLNNTMRLFMNYPVEGMNAMSALRLGTNLMHHELTYIDREEYKPNLDGVIGSDEDSIPMETKPMGEKDAIYGFKRIKMNRPFKGVNPELHPAAGAESCNHLVSGVATIAAAVARLKLGQLPIEPDPELSHAANFLYMMTGCRPSPVEERIMDVALILHADHGMNASTFASMVVASTLSDMYFSVGAGIAALNGPLHGGANEQVLYMLEEIGNPGNVKKWVKKSVKEKKKIMGFGHRVYKSYDPRARVLAPLAEYLVKKDSSNHNLLETATTLEKEILDTIGTKKKIFPNVDFYSGIVYACMGILPENFTTIFAVSRVAGWTSRILEYLENNRIFRPRAMYTGSFEKEFKPLEKRR
ncbi:MAG: citrate/2-methylcitrate synthase [Candidatus Omnitrophica bacterium]|nr:citrate/2-methylcitrate synthase [Candidatus Omnitrophota bacterium]